MVSSAQPYIDVGLQRACTFQNGSQIAATEVAMVPTETAAAVADPTSTTSGSALGEGCGGGGDGDGVEAGPAPLATTVKSRPTS